MNKAHFLESFYDSLMTHALGTRARKMEKNEIYLVYFLNSKFVSTHHLGGGELIWKHILKNSAPKKALKCVDIILVF